MTEQIITPDGEQPEVTPVDTGTEDVKAELEKVRKALREANKEAADRRKKLDAFEAAEKERQAAQMTELEKAQAEIAEAKRLAAEAEEARTAAEAKAQERLLKAAVIAEASKQGFNDPADAWLLVDRSKIEAGEDDSFKGLDKAIEAVLKAKPYLAKAEDRPRIGTPRSQPNGGKPPEPKAVKPIIRL